MPPPATDLTTFVHQVCGELPQVLILYGSHARGDVTAESDLDLAAFFAGPIEGPTHRVGEWRGAPFDLLVRPVAGLASPGPGDVYLMGGKLLADAAGQGAAFLAALDALWAKPPPALPEGQEAVLRSWAWKMLRRLQRGDVEGDYRRAWLLSTQIENWFAFQRRWYLGSKLAFATLQAERPDLFALFAAALAPGAGVEAIAALVEAVNGPAAQGAPSGSETRSP